MIYTFKLLKSFAYDKEKFYYHVFGSNKTRLYKLVLFERNFFNIPVYFYEYVGSILYDIENPAYSAEDVRKSIENVFKIKQRQEQIQKGPIA